MQLHALLHSFDPQLSLSAIPDAQITGVSEDSRLVQPGHLFIARAGTKTDGAAFIADAKARGAVAVVVQDRQSGCPLPQIVVSDAAGATSLLANLFHGSPSLK